MMCIICEKCKDIFHLTLEGLKCKCCLFWERYPVTQKQVRRTHEEVVLEKREKKNLLLKKREARRIFYGF